MEEETAKDQDSLKELEPAPLINLPSESWENLLQVGIDLNSLYLLEAFERGEDIGLKINTIKSLSWRQTLIRKDYVTDKGEITLTGKDLLKALREGKSVVPNKRKKVEVSPEFIQWWNLFPGTDTFEYRGRKFKGNRSLKAKKDECEVKFNKIINEGEYKTQELIDALLLEVNQKKEASYQTGQNKLSYLTNSLTYLSQRGFENYIELLRTKVVTLEAKTEVKQAIDI